MVPELVVYRMRLRKALDRLYPGWRAELEALEGQPDPQIRAREVTRWRRRLEQAHWIAQNPSCEFPLRRDEMQRADETRREAEKRRPRRKARP